MYRPRIIPVLLLKGETLVKTVAFKRPNYIGDPINAVHIFNDLRADELVLLDIEASSQNRCISTELVKNIGEEANMPFSVGGGIRTLEQIRTLIASGAEKVILGTIAVENIDFIRQAAEEFGSSTITVCVDVDKPIFGKEQVYVKNGKIKTGIDPVTFVQKLESAGAGEILIQSIKDDGKQLGYNIELISKLADAVSIPVVALGGAGSLEHMAKLYRSVNISGLAAGSMFVYQGKHNGVLINYPEKAEIQTLLIREKTL